MEIFGYLASVLIGISLGLIGGGIIGFKIATGDFFDTLVSPLRKVAEQDDKE